MRDPILYFYSRPNRQWELCGARYCSGKVGLGNAYGLCKTHRKEYKQHGHLLNGLREVGQRSIRGTEEELAIISRRLIAQEMGIPLARMRHPVMRRIVPPSHGKRCDDKPLRIFHLSRLTHWREERREARNSYSGGRKPGLSYYDGETD